jgi:hypothetical protein
MPKYKEDGEDRGLGGFYLVKNTPFGLRSDH